MTFNRDRLCMAIGLRKPEFLVQDAVMTEFELKFRVPSDSLAAVQQALGLAGVRSQRLQAAYFDTAERLLSRHHLSLRLRKEGPAWVQTLKAPGDSAVHRLEHNVKRPGRFGPDGPPLDPGLHAGSPAGDVLAALLSAAPGVVPPALQVVYRADIRRQVALRTEGRTRVEVALDQGLLQAGERRAEVTELEFELIEGAPEDVVALAASLVLPQRLWLSTISKAERGERLVRGESAWEAVHWGEPPLRGVSLKPEAGKPDPAAGLRPLRDDGPRLLRTAVAACLEQVMANASALADGHGTAEHVHQLRVGLRRLRTALRELAGLQPGWQTDWEARLADTFGALGESRDLDTVGPALAAQITAAGGPALRPHTSPGAPAPDPKAAVREPGFQAVLLEILAFTSARLPPDETKEGDDAALPSPAGALDTPSPLRYVTRRLHRLHRQIARQAAHFETLDPESQHRVRKRLKRLRYLAELTGGLFKAKRVKQFLEALKPAQEVLGDYNDALVARAHYQSAAEQGDPGASFAAGWLAGRQPLLAKSCSKALKRAMKARVFW